MQIVNGNRLPTVTDDAIRGFFGDYRFLSNFDPSPIHLYGTDYPTAEHAYQALKATDRKTREQISRAGSPGKAKRLGQFITLRPDWNIKFRVVAMRRVVRAKFMQNQDLADKLIATDGLYLEETNNWNDLFWGANSEGLGENKLGLILMDQRTELMLK